MFGFRVDLLLEPDLSETDWLREAQNLGIDLEQVRLSSNQSSIA